MDFQLLLYHFSYPASYYIFIVFREPEKKKGT